MKRVHTLRMASRMAAWLGLGLRLRLGFALTLGQGSPSTWVRVRPHPEPSPKNPMPSPNPSHACFSGVTARSSVSSCSTSASGTRTEKEA